MDCALLYCFQNDRMLHYCTDGLLMICRLWHTVHQAVFNRVYCQKESSRTMQICLSCLCALPMCLTYDHVDCAPAFYYFAVSCYCCLLSELLKEVHSTPAVYRLITLCMVAKDAQH